MAVMAQIRLDKYLADMQLGTRSEVKEMIRRGRVSVNGSLVKSPDIKVDISCDRVEKDGTPVVYSEYEYYMLNKPQGVLSAARDKKAKTVVDLISDKKRKDLFPIGRLDKDTEGLLVITNDGELTHKLLTPKFHVPKTYYAKVEGGMSEDAVGLFKDGIVLSDGTKTLPAQLEIMAKTEDITEILLTIYEGKFHQVKRMVEAAGGKVVYLKRLSMGRLELDATLKTGDYRPLTDEELQILKGEVQNA